MMLFIWIMIAALKGVIGPSNPWCCDTYPYCSCVQCYDGCVVCDGEYIGQCTLCSDEYYLLDGFCLTWTPLVIGENSLTLNFDNSIKLGTDATKNFVIGQNNGNAYPNFDANDPVPSISRGYYFFSYSYMYSTSLRLSPWFTVSFWVKPLTPGKFFSKKSSSTYFQYLEISAGQITYQVKVGDAQLILGSGSLSLIGNWHNIAITCAYSAYTTVAQEFVDGSLVKQISLISDLYNDPADTYLGNELSDGTFTGFIWRLIVYGSEKHATDDYRSSGCSSGCSFCSLNSNCPDGCGFKQFYSNGKCTDCSADCDYGCRHTDSCNLCAAKECVTCETFYECTSCVEGAILANSVCACDAGKTFNGVKCDYCDILCSSCASSKYFSCNLCVSPYYLVGQTCLHKAPYGWDSSKTSPYLVIDESFKTETFKGSYGIFITGTNVNTYAPFNVPDISDPIPMVKRGLFFNNGAYLTSNQEIYLPYEFTMNLWIKPKNGDFLEKIGKIIITYNLHATITLENYLASKFSFVTNDATSFSAWTFYSLVAAFSNSATTITSLTNGNSFSQQTYSQALFRDLPSNYLILGKSSSSNFSGFIYSFQLIIGVVTDFSNYMKSACGDASSSCLSVCDYNYYFDTSANTCKQCDSSCTMGCVRSASCNLCSDQLCKVCSGFGENLCTTCKDNAQGSVCSCNADSILFKSQWECVKCDSNYCGECSNREEVYFECKKCLKGVLFKGVCLDEVPYGYNEENCANSTCLLFKANFEADFSGSYGVFDTSDSVSTFYYWNSPDIYDPIPVKDRGLYFDSGKYLISHNKLYFPHTFSIVSWINSYGAGDIFEKDGKIILSKDFSVSFHAVDPYQSDLNSTSVGSQLLNSWNLFVFSTKFLRTTTSGTIYLNNKNIGGMFTGTSLFRDTSGYLTLGKSKNSSFKGFIYSFELYLGVITSSLFGDLKVCTSSDSLNCLSPCNIFEFFDEACTACNPSCTNSCVKAVSCSICKDPLCEKCPGFGDGNCIECVENAQGATCSCNSDSILVKGEVDWSCKKCDPDYCGECTMREDTYFSCNTCIKGVLFQGACVDEKPYGSDGCLDFPCLVINAELETDFKGSYDIFSTCDNINTFYFFNNPEPCDPIPAKGRGFYFNGSQYLISDPLYFSHTFSIISWINSYGVGDIFEKNQRIKVGSDFSAAITLISSTHESVEKMISSSRLDGWNRFELTVSFFNGVQTITISLNGDLANSLSEVGFLYRDASSYLTIGKVGANSYFKGFVYDFKLFIGLISDPSIYSTMTICALSSEEPCLSPCEFSEFYNNGCIACNSSCSHGCVRPKSCNICYDRLCINCSGFNDSPCNKCVENAQGSVCVCNPDSILIKYETDWACEKCDDGYCKVCEKREATYFDCTKCENGFLIMGVCLDEVPYGFDENYCSDSACLIINAEFDAEFSGNYDVFKTCDSSSTFNYWNNPEECDPVPIKGRGLHFNSSQFLVSNDPLYFSHTFSIVLWINSYGAGNIIEKENRILMLSNFSAQVSLINPFKTVLLSQSSLISLSDWNLFTLIVSFSNGSTTISAYLNEAQSSLNTYSQYLFRDESSHLFIGKGASSGFTGFIFNFKLFIGHISEIGSNANSMFCISENDKNCIAPCKLTEYFDGDCKSCNSLCTLNCVRSPSCKICSDQLCLECSGFSSSSVCYKCIERAHNLNDQTCICDDNTILVTDGSDYFCEYCDLDYCSTCVGQSNFTCLECSVGELIENVCLGDYPTGFKECVGKEPCVLAEINSKNNFNETYGKFIAGSQKATHNPFNSPESDDPVLAKGRGFFFDGNFSYLQSEQPYYFPHIFSLGMWIWNQGSGDILEQGDRLLLASNGSLSITLQDRFSQNFTFQTPGSSFKGWAYLSYSVSYYNSTTSLSVNLSNTEIIQQEFPNLLFRDIVNSTLFIGKSTKSYFKGFLYKLTIWNTARNNFDEDASTEICGASRDCLSPCKINEFYSAEYDKCKNCLSSCNKGCIRNDTCNICEDPLCALCPNFGKTDCIQCIPYASGIEKCNCIENYCLSLDRLKCIRTPYENSPEQYWIHSIPEDKIIVGNWSGEFIINTIHSFIGSVELLNSTDFQLSSNECSFSPFSENFTCSFMLAVNPSYNTNQNPLEVQVQYQGYLYSILFNAFYDDFSMYLMTHQQLINIKYYFEISYLKIKLYNQLAFTKEFCQDEKCSVALCDKILSKDSIVSFGKKISCFRIAKDELEIYLGNIQDSAKSLTFIEKVLTDSTNNDTNLAYITLSIKEEKPPQPKAIISNLGSTCCSCGFTLDASRSAGMGKLNYNWTLSKFLTYTGDISQNISKITLESCDTAKGYDSFDVTLTVTDKFGQSGSSWASVNLIFDEFAVTIANKETLNIGTDSPLKLKFQYQKSTKIDLAPNPAISWSVSKSGRQLSEYSNLSGIEFTYLFSTLGEYVVTANVLFNHGTYVRSASVKVIATPPPPNLMILGVNTTVYSNSYITVNLTATYGSDEIYPLKKGSVKFTENGCTYGKFEEIAGDSFNLQVSNKNSYFICNFKISLVDYPSVTGNHWVFVSPGVAPKVYIITKYPFLDWSSPVRILAHIENELKTDIYWGEANNLTFTPITPTNQAGITIKEFSLIPGTEYEFTVTVVDKETFARTIVSLKRYVNCPPNGGTFEIDHNSEGITLETEFGVLFSGWSDPENNEPLSYQIFIKLKDEIRALIPKTTENKFTIKLGVIGEAVLLGRVYDSYGTFIEIESIVYLNNTSSITITNFTENLAANGTETMDSSLLISSVTAAGLYITQTSNDDEEINGSISNSVEALSKWMNSSMKGTGLSDSSTVIDSVNILLGSSGGLNETTLVKLHSTQDKALNKTKVLDTHAYMTTLPNIDLVMQSLGGILERNSSDFTEMKIHTFVNKTYSEASLKYLVSVNPNEKPMNYSGEKFNSTCLSTNGLSISNNVSYNSSKPNTGAQFVVDTSKNPDSTVYLLSVLTLNPFNNISDGLQKEAVSSYSYPKPFTFNEGNLKIYSPDTKVNSNFDYSDQYESSLVQVGISQNINSIFNPVITDPPLTSVSVEVAYDVYDEELHMTCSVYLQQISQFSFKFCDTYISTPGVATCKCEIVGLIMIPPYPSVLRNLEDRIDPVEIEIPKVGAIPVFVIFGSLLFVFYLAWLDISNLEKKYADPLKELTLNINETIAKEIRELSSNLYVNNQKINVDKLMQIWELGEIYYENEWIESEEHKENTENASLKRYEVYPYFKKQLKNKLESIVEDQNILDSLLTYERIKMHIENSIDKRNLDDIETIIDVLLCKKNEVNEKFLLWAQFLYKKSGLLGSISKIKQKKIRKILRVSYSPIWYLSSTLEIFKRKIKYKHYNYILQTINKSILSTYEAFEPPEIDFTDIQLKCESKEILLKSVCKLEGNIFAYIKLRTPALKLEKFIRKKIFASLKDSATQSEGKYQFIRDDSSRRETNIPVGLPIVDLDDIRIDGIGTELEVMVDKDSDNEYTTLSLSNLSKVFRKLLEHQTDNFTPSASFIELFIENNDIFGIIGNTDLNFSRKGRLTYLVAAVSTEIAIAISAFDGYTKYIDSQVDLVIQFPEVTLIIWLVSFLLGFLPLFLKFFLKDRFLESQLLKNKNDPAKNWKVLIGYLISFSWIGGCWLYSFEKLNNYPISNIDAYLLYILQALILFLLVNGLILPAMLAAGEMYCCFSFVNLRVKRWINLLKRRISRKKEMQVLPTNDYEFSNRE